MIQFQWKIPDRLTGLYPVLFLWLGRFTRSWIKPKIDTKLPRCDWEGWLSTKTHSLFSHNNWILVLSSQFFPNTLAVRYGLVTKFSPHEEECYMPLLSLGLRQWMYIPPHSFPLPTWHNLVWPHKQGHYPQRSMNNQAEGTWIRVMKFCPIEF